VTVHERRGGFIHFPRVPDPVELCAVLTVSGRTAQRELVRVRGGGSRGQTVSQRRAVAERIEKCVSKMTAECQTAFDLIGELARSARELKAAIR
jgi:ribosomal protein S9